VDDPAGEARDPTFPDERWAVGIARLAGMGDVGHGFGRRNAWAAWSATGGRAKTVREMRNMFVSTQSGKRG